MVSPARKREAVVHLERQLHVSQRRACKVISINRVPPNAAPARVPPRMRSWWLNYGATRWRSHGEATAWLRRICVGKA